MNYHFSVGDKTGDDSLIILDEDRLCYSVRSVSNGGVGVRTISKALLAEWVEAYRKTPNAPSQAVREQLVGKSEIDRFEYGYAGTLAKMAKMILGQIPIIHAKADYSAEFCKWFAENRGKGKDTTAKKYISYFKTLTDTYQEPTNSYWHGLYRVMYSVDAEKDVIEIGESVEFERIYGGIVTALEEKVKGVGMTDEGFQRAIDWFWKPEVKSHTCVTSALNAYSDFLKWRETQQKKDDAPILGADLLSTALKMFAEKRYEEEWQAKTCKDAYQNVYAMADMTPEQIAAGSLDDFYENFLLKIWAFQNGGCRNYGQLDEAGKTAYRQFVVDLKTQLKSFDAYFPPNKKCPTGMGVGMLTEIMTRFWPKSCCNYNESLIHDAMVTLGLSKGDFVWPKTPSLYQDFMGKCATILCKMEQMKLPRRPNPNNDEPPDYITVNEFLWFVHDYPDLIKEEVMSKAMKSADYSTSSSQPQAKKPKVDFAKAEDVVLLRLAAALRAKPFAILAGHSGTGKSRMVRQLAYMTAATGNHKVLFEDADGKPLKSPGNFCMVQVKPNWHDSTDLLGYYSELKGGFKGTDFVKFICKAYAYPDVPFFVCLDEMNLAPVEQYFAEYLSAIESRRLDEVVILDKDGAEKTDTSIITDKLLADEVWRTSTGAQDFSGLGCEFTQSEHWLKKYGLTIPRNLFVVGTVNMDESTNQFSRKVLDRAFTLEMTDADFEHFGTNNPEPTYADFAGDDFAKALLGGDVVAEKPKDDDPQPAKDTFAAQIKNLMALKPVLDGTSFVVAYRFANEYMLYANALEKMCGVIEVSGEAQDKKPKAFDDMILMKVLPRITGDVEMVMRIFAGDSGPNKDQKSLDDPDVGGLAKLLGKDSTSFEKMKEIVKRGESNGSGTLTFWP